MFQLPVVTSQHDQRVSGTNSSVHCTCQHLVCCTHIARGQHIHVGFVLLDLMEVEVSKVVDGVV